MSEWCQYLLPLCLVEGVGKTIQTKYPQNSIKKELLWAKTFIYVRRFYSFKVLLIFFLTLPPSNLRSQWTVAGRQDNAGNNEGKLY